jgi:sugar phosphate permease
VNAASGRAIMHWFGAEQRGLALGLRQTAVTAGGAVAAVVLPAVEDAGGTKWALAALGLGCLATAALSAALLREGVRPVPDVATHALEPLRDVELWKLAGGSALLAAPQICLVGFFVVFLHERRGWSTGSAALLFALVGILGSVARVLAGRRSDVIGSRVTLMRAIAVGLAAAVAASAAAVGAPMGLLVAALVVAATLSMSWNGLAFTAVAELAGHARSGAALGFQQTILFVVGAVLPIPFAAVVAETSWQTAIALSALGPLAAWGVLRSVRETIRR